MADTRTVQARGVLSALWARVRVRALQKQMSMGAVLNEALQAWLEQA